MILLHEDDFAMAGSKKFAKETTEMFQKVIQVSKIQDNRFKFCGVDLELKNGKIYMSMNEYAETIKEIPIRKGISNKKATDQFIRDTGDDLEELESHLDLLKTRYSDYVASHERVFSKATDDQLPEADQIALDEAHDEIRRLHEAARTKIKSRKRQLIRAKDAAKEQTEAAAATQRETTARQNRITSLEQVLTQLYAKQVQEQNAMDGAIVQAARYPELVRFAAGFKIMHDRLIQADEVINEIAQLDPTKTMELDNRRFEKRSELTEKEAVIKYELLRKIQVSEERESFRSLS